MLDLYKNIKKCRLENNITQQELAEKAGYKDKSMIAKIEKGLVDLPQSKITIFANIFNITEGELMGWSGFSPINNVDNMIALTTIYEVYGYELYTLCDAYLSLCERENKEQMLSFASYLIKRERGNDFELLSPEEVNYHFSLKNQGIETIEKYCQRYANVAHARTDVDVPEGTDTSDNDIMDDDNF